MEKILPSSKLYSHPGRLLEDHLIGVARLSELFCQDKLLSNQSALKEITKIIALSHDLGKATSFFQDYLNADDKDKERLKNREETHHSLFSAVCAYFLVKDQLEKNGGKVGYYPFFAFEAVKRHHGNLRDVTDEAIFDDKDEKLLAYQLESVSEARLSVLARRLFEAGLPVVLTKTVISQWIDNISKELRSYKKAFRKNDGTAYNYLWLNLIYSILIDADKSDVVLKDTSFFLRKPDVISADLVDTFKSKKTFDDSPINSLRESAYKETLYQEINLDKKIYSINLPTGLGKTLLSLSFAMKLRECVQKSTGGKSIPRIIYALPFLSIIEQNADVIETTLGTCGIKPYSDILLKHHHLSEIFYKKGENEELESDSAKILIEGWNSEIIVTTFIQLFHSVISNRNRSLRKFHRFNGAIIILDEIQAIPIKYWFLINKVFRLLTDSLNAYILFVTATEPIIIEKKEMVSLVEGKEYFQKMDRVVIKQMLQEEMTLEDLLSSIEIQEDKRYLFIFNTINSAKQFYNLIKEECEDTTFLSTHVVPKERLRRIADIKRGEYKIVAATQLVEAGVDIDFDVVIRDIAPLDSINQASGRCNRNGRGKGTVYVVSLKDENGRKYASSIYDSVLLDITKNILKGRIEIPEREFLELINQYYRETKAKKSQTVSRQMLEAILKLRYDSTDKDEVSISDFRLIDENYSKKDVFVEIDEEAESVWREYTNLNRNKNLFEQKKSFDAMKTDFYKYVISVPEKTKNIPPEAGFLCHVDSNNLSEYYDRMTGFITRDDRSIVIW